MVVDTGEKFKQAVGYIRSQGGFGGVVLFIQAKGDTYPEWTVLNDATQENLTPNQGDLNVAYIQALIVADNEQQNSDANDKVKKQIATYMRGELNSVTPDYAQMKLDVIVLVNGNQQITNAIANVADLQGGDTETDNGYLNAALGMIALFL
jgi:hypothetical protein